MCRSIKVLRRPEPPLEPTEVSAAALQFVRKVSGYRAPSKLNEDAFNAAVDEIAAATDKLLTLLGPPRASSKAPAAKAPAA